METLIIPLSLVAGSLLSVQVGANAQLSKAMGSPFAATTVQLAVGTAVLILLTLLAGTMNAVAALGHVQWWHAIGGLASAFYVVSTILLFPRLGAVVSVGLFIAGQILASLGLDVFGVLGVAATGLQPSSAAGAAIVLAGATLIVFGQGGPTADASRSRLGWIVLALVAGAILPVQGAVNALLRADLGGAAFTVGAISFFVATLAMALVLVVTQLVPGAARPNPAGVSVMPWWGWLGGFAGATYVVTVFTALPIIGAAAAVGLTVAGQQIVSIFVDRFGWFRLPRRPVSAVRLGGVAVLLAGVAVITLH